MSIDDIVHPAGPTKEQIKAALGILLAIGEVIREKKGVPSGELYAQVMSSLSLNEYNMVIDKLVAARLVKRSNHFLTWIGPKLG